MSAHGSGASASLLARPTAFLSGSCGFVRTSADGGFAAARDIGAITVNRLPHGYAGDANGLYDPAWDSPMPPAPSYPVIS